MHDIGLAVGGGRGSAAGVHRLLRHRDVDDLGGECRDEVGGRDVEVDAVRATTDRDALEPDADASTMTGQARVAPNGVIAPRS